MSDYLKDAIQQGVILKRRELEEAGEKEKGKSWKPDFELKSFDIPVVIENKIGHKQALCRKNRKIKTRY